MDPENKKQYECKTKEWQSVEKEEGSDIIKVKKPVIEYKSFNSGDEVNDFFYYDDPEKKGILWKKKSQYGQWVKGLPDETREVIANYSTDGYDDINKYWRKVGDWENIDRQKVLYQTQKLDESISSFMLKDNLKVYRGVKLDVIADMFPDAGELKDLVGKIYKDQAFASTTPLSKIAQKFAEQNMEEGLMFEFDIPQGNGRGAYLDTVSAFGESVVGADDAEYEFLLKRGSSFEIYDIDESGVLPVLKGRWIE